ncbi:MAG: SpoIID/LytB domain-containing protein [Phycisphaerae bacterium]|nr:SpoIID/LytB domain-containing protein [Phycisphaerae bacterium]
MTKKMRNAMVKWLSPLLPVAMLVVACVAASLILSSCQPDIAAVPQKPLRFKDIPTVRVRLTPQRLVSAQIFTSSGYRILVDGQEVSNSPDRLKQTKIRREHGCWIVGRINRHGKRLDLVPTAGGLAGIGKKVYRGWLVFHAAKGNKFYVHNHVNMESYLASVVAKELYPNFHPEAYRAQAIAARTYALYEIATRGRKSSFDVWDSQASQVYGGMRAETDKSWAAVRSTHAWVLAHGERGNEQIFLTQFSACNGGYVNGAHVLRTLKPSEKIQPLAGGQFDGDGRGCPYYVWPPVKIWKRNIYEALAKTYPKIRKLGNLKTLRVKKSTAYGRHIWLEAVNRSGKAVPIRADDVRLCLLRSKIPAAKRLRSMNCKIRDIGSEIEFYDGKGFGHGVGLSQWGTEEKALRGIKAEEILEFYYPGATIFRAY